MVRLSHITFTSPKLNCMKLSAVILRIIFLFLFGNLSTLAFPQVTFNLGTTNGVTPNTGLLATYTNSALVPNSTSSANANFSAFNKVGAFIRANCSALVATYGSIIINIPSGTYYINGQTAGNNYAPTEALNLNGCTNVTVTGAGLSSTLITYTNNQKYGYFDATFNNPGSTYTCTPGHFINLYLTGGASTQNITIQNFTLNGGNSTFT